MSRTKHHKSRKRLYKRYEEIWGNLDFHNMSGKMYRGLRGAGGANKQAYHQKLRAKMKQRFLKELSNG